MIKESVEKEEVGIPLLQKNLQLKQQLLFYDKVFNTINTVIMVFDFTQFRMIWANDYFYKTVGMSRSRKNHPGKILDRYHPDDQDFLYQMKKHLENNQKDTFTGMYKFRNSKGKYLWFFTCANIFRYEPEEKIFEVVAVSFSFPSPIIYHKNLKAFSQEQLQDRNHKHIARISKREKQVIKYFANGFKTREIAELLGLSFHTVNNHRKNILKKLELKNLAALVNFAVEHGLD